MGIPKFRINKALGQGSRNMVGEHLNGGKGDADKEGEREEEEEGEGEDMPADVGEVFTPAPPLHQGGARSRDAATTRRRRRRRDDDEPSAASTQLSEMFAWAKADAADAETKAAAAEKSERAWLDAKFDALFAKVGQKEK
jgi:hypothetical protein